MIISVNVGPPAVTAPGLMTVMDGGFTKTETVFDGALPGLMTVTDAVPGCEMRFAGTWAVKCEASTKVVDSAVLFQRTVLPLTKFEPVTAKVKAGPHAATAGGFTDEICGAAVTVTATGTVTGLAPIGVMVMVPP